MMGGMFGRRKDLRFSVMFALRDGSKNGAEIMDSIEKMTFGFWRPSPGSLYPMLQKMVEEGTISKDESGKYSLEDSVFSEFGFHGHGRSGQSPRDMSESINEIEGVISYMEDIATSAKDENYQKDMDRIKAIIKRLEKIVSK